MLSLRPMSDLSIDPAMAKRIERSNVRDRSRPAAVDDALSRASKQFQLWDVERQVAPADKAGRIPVEFPRFRKEAPPSSLTLPRLRSSAAFAQSILASASAKKAFRGFRALIRQVFTKPFRK